MSWKTIVLLVVVMLALTAGCMGSDNDAGDLGGNGNGNGGNDASAPSAGNGNGDSANGGSHSIDAANANPPQERSLIRTAHIEVEIDDFDRSRSNLTAEAAERGGYLSDADRRTHERNNETWTTGTLTYRVPSEHFDAFTATVEAEGEVVTATTETEDVTDQLVDLEARIENLETQRERLRGLYEDANETADVLQIEERLSDVQGEIERLEAQRTSLEDRVAYSTVTVALSEPEVQRQRATKETEPEPSWYETPATRAFVSSVHGVTTVVRASIVAAAYLAPYLLVFGIPAALVIGARRRWRRRSPTEESRLEVSDGEREPLEDTQGRDDIDSSNGEAEKSVDDTGGESNGSDDVTER